MNLALFLLLQVQVKATVETDPVPSSGDAADDPCIWIHPTDPSKSAVIGTDKNRGLAVYDLSGAQLHFHADGEMNNVDLRYNFPLGGARVALVTAGNRRDNSIACYRVEPGSRALVNVAARAIRPGITIYGSCMYRSASGKTYAFLSGSGGEVEQWELFDDGSGKVDGKRVRAFKVGSMTEGCVADDALGAFYLAEETKGIWKFGAEPNDDKAGRLVDTTKGHLAPDVEGLAIYCGSDKTGYLIASSQGRSEFVVYEREGENKYVTTFKIVKGDKIDGAEDTDGIDVTNFDLGPAFPKGLFVAQNGKNDGGRHQSFLLVPWSAIAEAGGLKVDTAFDPRKQ
jgi:3-phytase